jgi:hypothetical protein
MKKGPIVQIEWYRRPVVEIKQSKRGQLSQWSRRPVVNLKQSTLEGQLSQFDELEGQLFNSSNLEGQVFHIK